MADRVRPVIEQVPLGGHPGDIELAVVVLPAAHVRARGPAQVVVPLGGVTPAAPLGVGREEPVGDGAFMPLV